MDKFDVLVVGAGFAGSVCAERLATAGRRVLVVDQRNHIGGNAYDRYDDAGVLIHQYGPHIFHTNSADVFTYLSRFTEWRAYVHRVKALVDGTLLPVPINRTTLAHFGGDTAAARAAIITPYTRKQWGLAPEQLDPAVLRRVQTRPDSDDDRYFTDAYQVMPAQGYTRIFERLLAHPRIHVLLQTPYAEIAPLVSAPTVIYSGSIDAFFAYRFGVLPYRSARFEFVSTRVRPYLQPVGVVNYPSERVEYTRVTEFKHLTGQRAASTTVCAEYPTAAGDPYWPIPTVENAARAQQYKAYAATRRGTPHVHFVGRLGTYQYLNIDQVVAQALKLARTLIAGDSHAHTVAS